MNTRRAFLASTVPTAIGLAAGFVPLFSQRPAPPQPRPPNEPGAEPGPETGPVPDPRLLLKQNQKELKKDVERLAELAQELKKEVEKTDSTEIFSLPMIRKAEEIEKLAKHIKNLARG